MMYAKKSLGQNFLHNQGVIKNIVDSAGLTGAVWILEIGPGHGALTSEMLARGLHVYAVEADKELYVVLQEKFATEIGTGQCVIVHQDIITFDEEILHSYSPTYHIIANIPYYLSGFIFRKFLSSQYQPSSMTLVVQKEVADRIVCRDGKESILSLSVRAYGTPHLKGKISAGSFSPPPKIDSAIIHIENISKNNFKDKEEELRFFTLVKTGLAHKRKQLRGNLKNIMNEETLSAQLQALGLPPSVRGEDINLSQWLALTRNFESCII